MIDKISYTYDWLFNSNWEEIAAFLMFNEEEEPLLWAEYKHQDWPKMLLDGLTSEHYGDCTKVAITCQRCMADQYYNKILKMRKTIIENIIKES